MAERRDVGGVPGRRGGSRAAPTRTSEQRGLAHLQRYLHVVFLADDILCGHPNGLRPHDTQAERRPIPPAEFAERDLALLPVFQTREEAGEWLARDRHDRDRHVDHRSAGLVLDGDEQLRGFTCRSRRSPPLLPSPGCGTGCHRQPDRAEDRAAAKLAARRRLATARQRRGHGTAPQDRACCELPNGGLRGSSEVIIRLRC